MYRVDVNCMIGHWPFRRLYKNTFEDLKKVHSDNNISSGYVSSLDSIFYNDPFEGEEELHEIIKGSGYKHVLNINPLLPKFESDIQKGVSYFDIKGVKIYPGYHGYTLDDQSINKLFSILEEFNMPLFVVLRMEDERLNHNIQPRVIPEDEISRLICRNSHVKIVLLNIGYYELMNLKEDINSKENVFFDTSGIKGPMFSMENIIEKFNINRILYGSLYPLYCLKSSLLLVNKERINETEKEKILYDNVNLLYSIK